MRDSKQLQSKTFGQELYSRTDKNNKRVIKKAGTILIVEDEESLAEILDFNLRRQGFNTLKATDGLEACRVIGRDIPDLILLDIMIPLLNGWEICHMVRTHHAPKINTTPIIILSALGTQEDKQKGYDLGPTFIFPNPTTLKKLCCRAIN